jgi:hypothetical protein
MRSVKCVRWVMGAFCVGVERYSIVSRVGASIKEHYHTAFTLLDRATHARAGS